MTSDVKSQIRFIEELDKIEKKKKDEAEREKLLKAAKVKQIYLKAYQSVHS
jgi:transcription initiation factor TFIID subunit 4